MGYSQYYYESNIARQKFIEGTITLDQYTTTIESLIKKEASGSLMPHTVKEELYEYEKEKMQSAIIEKEDKDYTELEDDDELTPERKLYKTRENYYRKEIPKIIEEYKKEAQKYRSTHNRYQWIIILGSALTTSITGVTIFSTMPTISLGLKLGGAVCSLLVTISASLTAYFRYRERSINAQKVADELEYQYDAIKLGTRPYLGDIREDAMGKFVDAAMSRIREYKEQQLLLEQPPEEKKRQSGA